MDPGPAEHLVTYKAATPVALEPLLCSAVAAEPAHRAAPSRAFERGQVLKPSGLSASSPCNLKGAWREYLVLLISWNYNTNPPEK